MVCNSKSNVIQCNWKSGSRTQEWQWIERDEVSEKRAEDAAVLHPIRVHNGVLAGSSTGSIGWIKLLNIEMQSEKIRCLALWRSTLIRGCSSTMISKKGFLYVPRDTRFSCLVCAVSWAHNISHYFLLTTAFPKDIQNQANACQEAETEQTSASLGPSANWQQHQVECQASSLAPHQVGIVNNKSMHSKRRSNGMLDCETVPWNNSSCFTI
jgi:hypothetical protein